MPLAFTSGIKYSLSLPFPVSGTADEFSLSNFFEFSSSPQYKNIFNLSFPVSQLKSSSNFRYHSWNHPLTSGIKVEISLSLPVSKLKAASNFRYQSWKEPLTSGIKVESSLSFPVSKLKSASHFRYHSWIQPLTSGLSSGWWGRFSWGRTLKRRPSTMTSRSSSSQIR